VTGRPGAVDAPAPASADAPAGVEHARREGLGYRPGLDGLRAVAILSVMAGHTWGWLFPGSFIGVDIFFVLSGFLITTLLLEERARTGRVSLRKFYARRALRLLPALGALVVAATVWILVTSPTPLRTASIHGLPAVVLYSSNWVYGLLHVDLGMFGHTWSLSLEEQFYLLWPAALLVILAWKRGSAKTALTACVLAIVFAALVRWKVADLNPSENGLRRLTNLRFDMPLMGCALALAAWRGWFARIPAQVAAVATAASLAVLVFFGLIARGGLTDIRFYRGGFTLVAAAAAVLIVRVVQLPSRPLLAVLASAPLVWIGRISYALYLWHTPIRDVLNGSLGSSPWRALVVWPLAFGAATASYFLIERPALRLKDRLVAR